MTDNEGPNLGGRPTLYKSEYDKQAEKLCQLGATDIEIADFFEVDVRTIYRWKADHDGFCQSLKAGKEIADERVERSLYQRAVGYTFESEKIVTVPRGNNMGSEVERVPIREHVAPDTTAQIFWLKNRRGDEWREKQDVNLGGQSGNPVITQVINTIVDPNA